VKVDRNLHYAFIGGGIEMATVMAPAKREKVVELASKQTLDTDIGVEVKGAIEMVLVTKTGKPETKPEAATKVIEKEASITSSRKPERELKGREAILAVLARAADDTKFLAKLADNPAEALQEYYTLTWEEKAALASGDIRKIEAWVGKLDKRLATWLWCRLSQEKW
jgi:hypothetical protein